MAEEKILTEKELDGVSGGSRIAASDKAKVDVDKLRKLVTDTACEMGYRKALADNELNCVTGGSMIQEGINESAKGTTIKATPVVNDTVDNMTYSKALADSELNNITGGGSITTDGTLNKAKTDTWYKETLADSTSDTLGLINKKYTK